MTNYNDKDIEEMLKNPNSDLSLFIAEVNQGCDTSESLCKLDGELKEALFKYSILKGDAPVMTALIEDNPAIVNAVDKETGKSPLDQYLLNPDEYGRYDNLDVIDKLIEKGGDLNILVLQDKQLDHLLNDAVLGNLVNLAEFTIDKGAIVNGWDIVNSVERSNCVI